jgi:hypothetical protein
MRGSGYTIEGASKRLTFFSDPAANEHYYGALRLAGLPEHMSGPE